MAVLVPPAGVELPVYLDYNATTPLEASVASAMRPFLEVNFGNPSSSHPYGARARQAVEHARANVALLLNAKPHEIVFTSGGSESTNWALKGFATAHRTRGDHIITSAIEVCKWLETQGFRVSYIGVDKYGVIDLQALKEAITIQTILITVMHSNNEVGTIQPIAGISKLAKEHGIVLHTDAAQSAGKVKLDVDELGVDMVTLACHKFYAPKGIGVLYIRSGVQLSKMMHGAPHESGRRAGTENTIHIAGLGAAALLSAKSVDAFAAHMKSMRDRLWAALQSALPDAHLNGHPELRLPNTLSVSFPQVQANTLLAEVQAMVAASAGAACHSDKVEVSHVLTAMHVPVHIAMGTVRFSTGRHTSSAEIDYAASVIIAAVKRLQPSSANEKTPALDNIDAKNVKLTSFTSGLGCACKLKPQALHEVLRSLGHAMHPSLLVGTDTGDDAAVYQVNGEQALVATLDFLTPIVDDPYTFGQIACANSLSDVYAMGGRPIFALNIVAFPSNRLPLSVLEQILLGSASKAKEAGVLVVGGHTIEDNEPKFGLSVTGEVHPQHVLRNAGVRQGDVLVLTKAIGTGIITTAMKRDLASPAARNAAVTSMSTLNNKILAVLSQLPGVVHAATDVTGFGLLGHLRGMSKGSGIDCEIYASEVPLLADVLSLASTADLIPGGTRNNLAYVAADVTFEERVAEPLRLLLADAQTSGGLLLAVDPTRVGDVVAVLRSDPNPALVAAVVGRFTSRGSGHIFVTAFAPAM